MTNSPGNIQKCTVAVVGGGPAGLALATELRLLGVEKIIVLEREPVAGGVPRHCGHYPFGIKEFKRMMKGPDYAAALVRRAKFAGVDIRTSTTVTALHPNGRLTLSTDEGVAEIQADRVVLCTGVRESSRAQQFISGQRPMGVMSTGALQSLVYLQGLRPFQRPVILGTELVSFSAIMTCRHLGMRPAAMIEQDSRVTVRQFMRPYPAVMGVPVHFGVRDIHILGGRNVEAIEYTNPAGVRCTIKTDGVIVSGNFRPEAALLRASHLEVDPATGGPCIDQFGRSSDPSYFCTGNLLRPVETSSWCWHEAVATAGRVARDLVNPIGAGLKCVQLASSDPAIRYVVPQRLVQSDVQGGIADMQIRLNQPVKGQLVVFAGKKSIWTKGINSRQERRILAPMKPALDATVSELVELKIK